MISRHIMRSSALLLLLLGVLYPRSGIIHAQRTGPYASPITDATILNFALALEQLSSAFYANGLTKYDASSFNTSGFPPEIRSRYLEIAAQKRAHVQALIQALADNGNATLPCEYNFPHNDTRTFTSLSQILEGVGTSAYISLISQLSSHDDRLLASRILSTRARHASWIAVSVNSFTPWGGPFDVPLDMDSVYTFTSKFIISCPSTNPSMPLSIFPALLIGAGKPGTTVPVSFNDTQTSSSAATSSATNSPDASSTTSTTTTTTSASLSTSPSPSIQPPSDNGGTTASSTNARDLLGSWLSLGARQVDNIGSNDILGDNSLPSLPSTSIPIQPISAPSTPLPMSPLTPSPSQSLPVSPPQGPGPGFITAHATLITPEVESSSIGAKTSSSSSSTPLITVAELQPPDELTDWSSFPRIPGTRSIVSLDTSSRGDIRPATQSVSGPETTPLPSVPHVSVMVESIAVDNSGVPADKIRVKTISLLLLGPASSFKTLSPSLVTSPIHPRAEADSQSSSPSPTTSHSSFSTFPIPLSNPAPSSTSPPSSSTVNPIPASTQYHAVFLQASRLVPVPVPIINSSVKVPDSLQGQVYILIVRGGVNESAVTSTTARSSFPFSSGGFGSTSAAFSVRGELRSHPLLPSSSSPTSLVVSPAFDLNGGTGSSNPTASTTAPTHSPSSMGAMLAGQEIPVEDIIAGPAIVAFDGDVEIMITF